LKRVLALDYGAKRTGIAVTDPLQIICSPLDTVETKNLMAFLKDYFLREPVEAIALGYPTHADGNPTHLTPAVEKLEKELNKNWPDIPVHRIDERYTSLEAERIIFAAGYKKKQRQDKAMVDRVAASLILQMYMDTIQGRS
jgi:putative holliday junction resolvase